MERFTAEPYEAGAGEGGRGGEAPWVERFMQLGTAATDAARSDHDRCSARLQTPALLSPASFASFVRQPGCCLAYFYGPERRIHACPPLLLLIDPVNIEYIAN